MFMQEYVNGYNRGSACMCVAIPHGQVSQRKESFPALLTSGRSNSELC